MLGYDEHIKKPKIISKLLGITHKLFHNENIIELVRPLNYTKYIEIDCVKEHPGLCSVDRLTPSGLTLYELLCPIFSSIKIDELRKGKEFVCCDNPDKPKGKVHPMKVQLYISAYKDTKWLRDDMWCVKESPGSCCFACIKYVKLEKLYSVYLSSMSLFNLLVDHLFEEKHKKIKCLEEEILEKQFNEELEQLDCLDSLENQILNMTE